MMKKIICSTSKTTSLKRFYRKQQSRWIDCFIELCRTAEKIEDTHPWVIIKHTFLEWFYLKTANLLYFHEYDLLHEINLLSYISSISGIATSSIDHFWHNLNSPGRSYVVSPALWSLALCVIFRTKDFCPQ